jgi:hypothetical protein
VIAESPTTLVSVPKRGEIAQASEPGELLAELPGLQYPVVDQDSLIHAMSPCRKYFVRGAEVDVARVAELPAWLFRSFPARTWNQNSSEDLRSLFRWQ